MSTADDVTGGGRDGEGAKVVQLTPRTGTAPRPEIDITHENEAVEAITDAINHTLPDLYSMNGKPVEVAEVITKTGPKLLIPEVGPSRIRKLLARHAFCYRWQKGKDGEPRQTPGLPSVSTVQAALDDRDWPGLRPLVGVTRMPIVRPDGTVLTARGYDQATRLYYWPAFAVPDVPDDPSPEECREARRFLLDYLLRDICWDKPASRANYMALLFTPLLRLYIGGLLPFGVISAATPGSGKSLLTEVLKNVYGMHGTTWPRTGEEFDKRVTGYLQRSEPVVCFDNVGDGVELNHAELAALLTQPEYGGRTLGTNDIPDGANDKLWLATGNNLIVGTDIASRSVLVRLDPQMEEPEKRTGFAIEEDIWKWLGKEPNQIRIMHSLLVLVRAWIARGAPRATEHRMRNFTEWAQILGGLVAWLELEDFLANAHELKSGTDEKTTVVRFLAKWHEKFGDQWKSAQELIDSARWDMYGGQVHDPWDGAFVVKEVGGKTVQYTSVGLGRYLNARRDRIFSGYRLRKSEKPTNGTFYWRVQAPDDKE